MSTDRKALRPENTPAGSVRRRLSVRSSWLWGGGIQTVRLTLVATPSPRARVHVCECFAWVCQFVCMHSSS